MKLFTTMLILICVSSVMAQEIGGQSSSDRLPGIAGYSAADALNGQLGPVLYTGIDSVGSSGASHTTRWLQIGWVMRPVNQRSNQAITRFNPDQFTVTVQLDTITGGAGDSLNLATARFECVWDTSANGAWNPDSSNCFIAKGNYNRNDYGSWTFEHLLNARATLRVRPFSYPIRVLRGGFIRFVWAGNNDSTKVTWTLSGER